MNRNQNFKKMYLVSAQNLEKLTKQNVAYSNDSLISRTIPENNAHLSNNTSKFRTESDPVVEGGEKAITFTKLTATFLDRVKMYDIFILTIAQCGLRKVSD